MQLEGNVLITGGSGYFGRAVLRRAKREKWPATFTIYSRDETKQWEVKRRYPETRCVLGDIARDFERLVYTMQGHDVVIHAGAVKYIPEAEHNVFETVAVNVEGSRNVALAARAAGVKTVIGISTDKACGPLNVYGMTKGIMERMFSEANRMGDTHFITCRYGNVVGSTGSVVPVFMRQIEEYGELRITDSRMTRFWMSVDQAVDTVLWAYDEAKDNPGVVCIPFCPAMKVVDLARAVWRMKRHGDEPEINYTGIRPGEKLHEELFNEQEAVRAIRSDERGYYLVPATEPAHHPTMMSYSSNHPLKWLSAEEVIEFVHDSESV
jgi:UDP-N-acetylglucosamine 4,6-dehydratase